MATFTIEGANYEVESKIKANESKLLAKGKAKMPQATAFKVKMRPNIVKASSGSFYGGHLFGTDDGSKWMKCAEVRIKEGGAATKASPKAAPQAKPLGNKVAAAYNPHNGGVTNGMLKVCEVAKDKIRSKAPQLVSVVHWAGGAGIPRMVANCFNSKGKTSFAMITPHIATGSIIPLTAVKIPIEATITYFFAPDSAGIKKFVDKYGEQALEEEIKEKFNSAGVLNTHLFELTSLLPRTIANAANVSLKSCKPKVTYTNVEALTLKTSTRGLEATYTADIVVTLTPPIIT